MADCCGSNTIGFPPAADMAQIAMNWPVVWAEIAAIQQAILQAASSCVLTDCNGNPIPGTGTGPGSGGGGGNNICIGGNTPMTFIDGISSVKVINGGMGYYTDIPGVAFIPPYGVTPTTVATGTVITNGSKVLSINITDPGAGYTPTRASVSASSVTGSGAVFAVITGFDGSVYGITVIDGGSGYLPTDVINVVRAVAPNPMYINAHAVIGGLDSTGGILCVNVMNPGTGYQPSFPQVKIVSSLDPTVPYITGVGFQGNVLLDANGGIISVIITNGGLGYTPLPPQLIINDPGTGAEFRVNLDGNLLVPPGNAVKSIDVLESGDNYTQNATGTVINPPTAPPPTIPAQVQIIVPVNPYCTNPNLYYQVWAGTITNKSILAQINFVLTYFKQLGYNIVIKTNPESGDTFMWCICW